jgi:hypothetical protein
MGAGPRDAGEEQVGVPVAVHVGPGDGAGVHAREPYFHELKRARAGVPVEPGDGFRAKAKSGSPS